MDQTDGLQRWVRGARLGDNLHHSMSPAKNRAMFNLGARGLVLCALLVAVLASWVLFHSRIHRALASRLLLESQSPRDELFQELAGEFADPGDFLRVCWATGKIPHRQLVASFLRANARSDPAWFGELDPLVLGGTIDADMLPDPAKPNPSLKPIHVKGSFTCVS